MRTQGYRFALQWLIDNEDSDWMTSVEEQEDEPILISVALAADIFGKTEEQIREDLRRLLLRRNAAK